MTKMVDKRLVLTVASTVITSSLAVAVNVATKSTSNAWAWLATALLTVAAAGSTYVLNRRSKSKGESSGQPIRQSVHNAAVGGTIVQIGQANGDIDIR